LLINVVRGLQEHKNYIITITNDSSLSEAELEGIEIVRLDYKSFFSLPQVIWKLRKLIAKHKPDIVHAHLPFTSLITRLATPSHIKLFISVHNTYSESFQRVSPRLFYLEKKLHSKRENLIFVSSAIKEDYNRIVGIKGRSFVLYNCIADKFFSHSNEIDGAKGKKNKFRMVAIGSLKYQKNFDNLIKAFSLLDKTSYSLDIYGDGPERMHLESLISQYQLSNIHLKGSVPDVETHLKYYDAFILASRYEGFGLAPLEAAAIGLPLLLSDIDVFKEITMGYAIYFSAENEKDIADKLRWAYDNYEEACEGATIFKPLVKENYSKHGYMQKLMAIYQS